LTKIPDITDEAIYRACGLLSLPKHAFHGDDNNDSRLDVIKSLETIDVEACPGSGKTTLLVAKLAILSKTWPYRNKGICVLSHTNAAREEISGRLGPTPEGYALLKFPHFIGTIHGFVNEFVATPWLLSKGIKPKVIDDDFVLNKRWQMLPEWIKSQILRSPNNANYPQATLRVINSNYDIDKITIGRNQTINKESRAFGIINRICKKTSEEGYLCFNEMFVWAKDALEKNPLIKEVLRSRFPVLFIDEVQDNSQLQSEMLFNIFMEGNHPVVRQRFGDSNQAIYSRSGVTGSTVDTFPSTDSSIRRALSNSYRFGPSIARLSNQYTINSIHGGLQGHGPSKRLCEIDRELSHTIFLFNENNVESVLENFAILINEEIKQDKTVTSQGDFVAVSAVHNTPTGKIQPAAHYIGHYHSDYNPKSNSKDESFCTFAECLISGKSKSLGTGNTSQLLSHFASGIVRALQLCGSEVLVRTPNKYQHIKKQLSENLNMTLVFKSLSASLIDADSYLSSCGWDSFIQEVKKVILGLDSSITISEEANAYLSWPSCVSDNSYNDNNPKDSNVYTYITKDKNEINIRLGSIHSVKGQTHTATLVLDSFNRTYHLKALKDWVLGKNRTEHQISKQSDRLKLHFVAMTRPTHLLCLAMRKDIFSDKEILSLQDGCSWNVVTL